MKRYRPPKHRRKHYDPQPSKRRANIYALTHARALYFYAALRVNSNYGTPQRFQDLTAPTLPPPPANSGMHAGASSRAAPIPCSAAPVCRQVALWAKNGLGGIYVHASAHDPIYYRARTNAQKAKAQSLPRRRQRFLVGPCKAMQSSKPADATRDATPIPGHAT